MRIAGESALRSLLEHHTLRRERAAVDISLMIPSDIGPSRKSG